MAGIVVQSQDGVKEVLESLAAEPPHPLDESDDESARQGSISCRSGGLCQACPALWFQGLQLRQQQAALASALHPP